SRAALDVMPDLYGTHVTHGKNLAAPSFGSTDKRTADPQCSHLAGGRDGTGENSGTTVHISTNGHAVDIALAGQSPRGLFQSAQHRPADVHGPNRAAKSK